MRGEDCKLRLLKEGTKKMNLGKTANILFQEASSEYKWYFAEDWRILKVLKEEWKPKQLRLQRWRVAEEEWSGRSTDSCHPPALFCQWRSSWLLASPILCTLRWYPLSFSESSHYIVQLRHKSYISSHFADENIFVTQESQHILNGYWHMAVFHLPPDHRSSHFHTRLFHHNFIWWVFIKYVDKVTLPCFIQTWSATTWTPKNAAAVWTSGTSRSCGCSWWSWRCCWCPATGASSSSTSPSAPGSSGSSTGCPGAISVRCLRVFSVSTQSIS